jgi:glycerol-3-phosphate dehydrogenase
MKRDFAALQGEFDLLVCGGGIYGAWTAYDAALRGLKVALVEREGVGSVLTFQHLRLPYPNGQTTET